MNIDSLNILSIPSAGEGIDPSQTLITSDGAEMLESSEFSDALMQNIENLQNLNINLESDHFLGKENLIDENQLNDIAVLLPDRDVALDISSVIGNELPQNEFLDKNIDLKNTLETLTQVLNTLGDSVQMIAGEQLLVELPVEVEQSEQPEKIIESDQLLNSLPVVEGDVSNSENEIPRQQIITEVGEVKRAPEHDLLAEEIEQKIAPLLSNPNEFKPVEKELSSSVYRGVDHGFNTAKQSNKQSVEIGSLNFATDKVEEESVEIGQTVNKQKQVDMDLPLMAKQQEKSNVLESKIPEQATDKIVPKFAMDIANLNRAVIAGNKTEIPPMTKHFSHPEWNKEMGEKVIWMHKQAIPSAELRLNPGHLGPIKIKIDMTQDQATIAFTAQHAAVKEAIDAALPKLREMLSAQQLNLAEVSVSQENSGQKQHKGFQQMESNTGDSKKDNNEIIENEFSEKVMDITEEIEAGRAIASSGVLSIFA